MQNSFFLGKINVLPLVNCRRIRMHLLPFDVIVAIVRFFGIKEAHRFCAEARVLLSAFKLNPAVREILKKQRYVEGMEVRYDKDEYKWIVNGTKPLPLVKPPSVFLGFEDISIGFSAESNLEVIYFFHHFYFKSSQSLISYNKKSKVHVPHSDFTNTLPQIRL